MTVLTAAILDEEKKEKLDLEKEEAKPEDPAIPVVVKSKDGVIAVVRNRRTFARSPHRLFLFIVTLIGLLCAIGGLCYGIYIFAKLGHNNRNRIFCKVIEANPFRRTRIIAEKADISDDGRALRLFNPSFMYIRQLYRSSMILILAELDISVIKVKSVNQCFVKPLPKFRRNRQFGRLEILRWYRQVEEGVALPDLHLLRRRWIARRPHLSHSIAAKMYHPKVAEFCKEMHIFRLMEIRQQHGVVQFQGGLLPKCPLRKCNPCQGDRYVHDKRGCRTCQCKPLYCPICTNYCKYGHANMVDSRGCSTCNCRIPNKHQIRTRSVDQVAAPLHCRSVYVSSGIIPTEETESYDLEDIQLCS